MAPDGVIDRLDNCPGEKGALRFKGCAIRQLVAIRAGSLELAETVVFRTDKAEIHPRSFRLLDNVAAVLVAHPEVRKLEIEGHTDNQGDDARRIAAIINGPLIDLQVKANRTIEIEFTKTVPRAGNSRKLVTLQEETITVALENGKQQKLLIPLISAQWADAAPSNVTIAFSACHQANGEAERCDVKPVQASGTGILEQGAFAPKLQTIVEADVPVTRFLLRVSAKRNGLLKINATLPSGSS